MTLIERKDNFYRNYNEQWAQLNKHSKVSIALNPRISHSHRRLERVKTNFEKRMLDINEKMNAWKQSHVSAQNPFQFDFDPNESARVLKRAKWLKIALKVCIVVGAVLAGVGLLAACGAFALADSCNLSLQMAKILLTTFGLGLSSGGLLLLTGHLMSRVKLLRQETVISDTDFKEFVAQNFSDNNDFNLDKKTILDPTIHRIYHQFRRAVKLLPTK